MSGERKKRRRKQRTKVSERTLAVVQHWVRCLGVRHFVKEVAELIAEMSEFNMEWSLLFKGKRAHLLREMPQEHSENSLVKQVRREYSQDASLSGLDYLLFSSKVHNLYCIATSEFVFGCTQYLMKMH